MTLYTYYKGEKVGAEVILERKGDLNWWWEKGGREAILGGERGYKLMVGKGWDGGIYYSCVK